MAAKNECPGCEVEGTKGYELGIVSGVERAAGILEGKAAVAFRNRADKQAFHLRDMADQLMIDAKELRKAYDKKYSEAK